jgi:hypothetical protein
MTRAWPLLAAAALSLALGACDRQRSPNAATQPVPGTSDPGTADATGQAGRTGAGLNGGLGGTATQGRAGANPTQSAGAGPDDGSKNRTPHNSVGNR